MSTNADSRFVSLVRSWLVSLPHDLKVAYEAMDDENLPRPARELAAGAIVYIVSPHEVVKDRNEAVASYVDDAILLRVVLGRILNAGESSLRERFPEVFEAIDEELALCKASIGDLMGWLEAKADALPKQEHKGRKTAALLDNDEAREELFEDGLVFGTDYPIDEETAGDKLKKASTVTDGLKRRRAEETRNSA